MARRPRRRPARRGGRVRKRRGTEEREELERLRTTARESRELGEGEERDALVAMIAVKALDRARELAQVEGGSLGLRRALAAAQRPLAEWLARHLRQRRRKA